MHTREYIYSLESTLASWHLDCSYIILLYSIDGCGDRVEVSKCVSVSGFLNSAYGGVAGRPNRCLWRQQFSQQGAKQEYINLLSINPARPPTSNLPPSIQSPTSTFKLEPMRTARFRNQQPLSQSHLRRHFPSIFPSMLLLFNRPPGSRLLSQLSMIPPRRFAYY